MKKHTRQKPFFAWGMWEGLELVDSSKVKHIQVEWTPLNFPLLVSRNLCLQ